jgi:hypothetical protein
MAWAGVALGIDVVSNIFDAFSSKDKKQSDVSAQAQILKNGDLVIQLDPENRQVIISVEEDDTIKPIVFDLKNGLILNAQIQSVDTGGGGTIPPPA